MVLWLRLTTFLVAALLLGGAFFILVDPLERIRLLEDNRLRRDAENLLSVCSDYYLLFYEYPWDVFGEGVLAESLLKGEWVEELVEERLVRRAFAQRSSWEKLYLSERESLFVCFNPCSKKMAKEALGEGKDRGGSPGCLAECAICLYE
jgi:hypothetical protein